MGKGHEIGFLYFLVVLWFCLANLILASEVTCVSSQVQKRLIKLPTTVSFPVRYLPTSEKILLCSYLYIHSSCP